MRVLKTILIVLLVCAVIVFIFPFVAYFATEVLWWKNVGYFSAFLKKIFLKSISFLLPFFFSLVFLTFWLYGLRRARKSIPVAITVWLLSIGAGVYGSFQWKYFIWNAAFNKVGYSDPIFHLDAYFYMFRLPLLRLLLILLAVLFAALFVIDLIVRDKNKKPLIDDGRLKFDRYGVILLLLNSLTVAALFASNVFESLVTQPNAKLGIGYSEAHGLFIGQGIFIAVFLIFVFILLLQNRKGIRIVRLFVFTLIAAVVYFLAVRLYPTLIENYSVKPNELMMQESYIRNRIESTRRAFAIDLEDYTIATAEDDLFGAINKARIWDNEPYKAVIKQMQEVKTYFDFVDVDVDEYTVSNETYQVVLSARELNANNLPPDAMTWDNTHLRYTHGYGITLSPANMVNPDGNPIFWVRDLENATEFPEFRLDRPQIYFGELTSNYVVVRTTAEEFEYTSDTNRIVTRYRADRGVPIYGFFRKLIYAVTFKDKTILFSKYYTPESRILYRRQILERVNHIFPYLEYDNDPYITVIGGKLYWIIDAYTISDRFPLAQRFSTALGEINYLRNSVKVVVDAYTGDVFYYIVDKQDPIALAYRSIFPELFSTEVPPEFEEHFRYPGTVFRILSDILCTYHVENYESFYNGEDVWKIPEQIYGSEKAPFSPYYILVKINGAYRFSLIEPFNPMSKENLASWLVAYYDNGPRLALKYVERTSVSLGPLQVESLINQDDTMSRLFTLWGQKGSKVFRGNIQFLPMTRGVLYLEPILLESMDASIPQLVKLVAVVNNNVYIGDNFSQLLGALSGLATASPDAAPNAMTLDERIRSAYLLYLEAEKLRIQGDINGYQEIVDTIGRELKDLVNLSE